MTNRHITIDVEINPKLYLVVNANGLIQATTDKVRASTIAEAYSAVVAECPVVEDHRRRSQ